MKRTGCCAAWTAACVLALAVPTAAQEVTVEALVAIALERAPALRAARAEAAAAAGMVTQAGLRPNPTIVAGQEQSPGSLAATTVTIEWPLALFRRHARTEVAEREADVTALSIQDRERLLASTVRDEAGRVLAARRRLDLTNEALAAARRTRDLLDRRVSEGGAALLDANLAAVEAMRLEADSALAAGELEAAAIRLKAVAGLPPEAPLVLTDSLEGLAPLASPDAAPEDAVAARPDLREAVARVTLADARVERIRREGRYDLTLIGGYGRTRMEFPQLGADRFGAPAAVRDVFHTVTVGARVSLPLFDSNQGALATAQAERERADALAEARRLSARAEIDGALARDREARRAVQLYDADIRRLAGQNVEVVLEGYDLGRFTLAELLAEQRRYLDVEEAYTTVLLRAYDARTAVVRAVGEPR